MRDVAVERRRDGFRGEPRPSSFRSRQSGDREIIASIEVGYPRPLSWDDHHGAAAATTISKGLNLGFRDVAAYAAPAM